MLHSFHSQPMILPRHGVWTGTTANAVIYSNAIHPHGQGGAAIAHTSCSPNVSTDKSASGLKNPASRFEKPAFVVASFLLQLSIHQAHCTAAFLSGHLSLTPTFLKQESMHSWPQRCALSPFASHPTQISTFSPLQSSHLDSKVPSLSPISLSPCEPGSLENHSAHACHGSFPWNSNN